MVLDLCQFPLIHERYTVKCSSRSYAAWVCATLHILYGIIENHHVMTCIGNRTNAAFIPDNFDHVLIAVEIMILPPIFVETIWI